MLRIHCIQQRYGLSDPAIGKELYETATMRHFCKHIPDRHEHLVRTVGRYSDRGCGARATALKVQDPAT